MSCPHVQTAEQVGIRWRWDGLWLGKLLACEEHLEESL